jgi:hypothetical protein
MSWPPFGVSGGLEEDPEGPLQVEQAGSAFQHECSGLNTG